jgi:hypothetical protein
MPDDRLYIPKSVRAYWNEPSRLSNAPFAIIALGASLWLLHWWGLLVAAFAISVSVLIRVWGEAKTNDRELEAKTAELRSADGVRDQLHDEVVALEVTVAELRERVAKPELGLPQLLHVVARHIERIDLVRKHRAMRDAGTSEWPVTTITLGDPTVVFSAEAPGAAILAGETVWIIERATGRPLGAGNIVPASESRIEIQSEFGALPDAVQEQAARQQELDPGDFFLQLAGLTFTLWRRSRTKTSMPCATGCETWSKPRRQPSRRREIRR